MPRTTDSATEGIDTGIALLLGEIRGQMRELIHSTNNAGMKIDALAARVSALEAEHNRRQGANNVVQALLKSPAFGWLVGIAVSAWAILSGKVHP
ncbi:hypothetical protein GCM10009087_52060 [Sphingomonas oligophenolica]|uniref:DUF3618 domain-containing protein n=1 Tax=Sphingomonas oligophenolica TaxID=301154 RepID=A0ABU9Y6V3_9SPHN